MPVKFLTKARRGVGGDTQEEEEIQHLLPRCLRSVGETSRDGPVQEREGRVRSAEAAKQRGQWGGPLEPAGGSGSSPATYRGVCLGHVT